MRIASLICVLCLSHLACGGTLELRRFETSHACPPYEPPASYELAYRLFQASLQVLPEESIVSLSALTANSIFDYQERSADSLAAETYESVQRAATDPLIAAVPTTLPYSFSELKPDYGMYYIWTPDRVTEKTRTIYFLHGFGGCFRYYAYFMKEAFPDDFVILPVYGYSGALISRGYLFDLNKDLKKRGFEMVSRPWLMGISAGGYSVFRLYGEQPQSFAGAVSIASLCLDRDMSRLTPSMNILMVNGNQEQGISKEVLESQHRSIVERVGCFEPIVLEGDHFFLFTKESEVINFMRTFVEKVAQPTQ